MLWLANGRSYKEVLASVETRIDSTLSKEEYHIYDANGKRYIDGGSQAAIRYGVYALQRAEVLGKADAGLDIHEKPYYEYRILNHWDNLDDTVEEVMPDYPCGNGQQKKFPLRESTTMANSVHLWD